MSFTDSIVCCETQQPCHTIRTLCCSALIHTLCLEARCTLLLDETCPRCHHTFDRDWIDILFQGSFRECGLCRRSVWSAQFNRIFECNHSFHLDCAGEQYLLDTHLNRHFNCVVCSSGYSEEHLAPFAKRTIHLGWHALFEFLNHDPTIPQRDSFRAWLEELCVRRLTQCRTGGPNTCQRFTPDATGNTFLDFEAEDLRIVTDPWSGERAMAFVSCMTMNKPVSWKHALDIQKYYAQFHTCTENCQGDQSKCLMRFWKQKDSAAGDEGAL